LILTWFFFPPYSHFIQKKKKSTATHFIHGCLFKSCYACCLWPPIILLTPVFYFSSLLTFIQQKKNNIPLRMFSQMPFQITLRLLFKDAFSNHATHVVYGRRVYSPGFLFFLPTHISSNKKKTINRYGCSSLMPFQITLRLLFMAAYYSPGFFFFPFLPTHISSNKKNNQLLRLLFPDAFSNHATPVIYGRL
jgi:hypothetical protein